MAAILDLCKWGLSGTASTCVPFLNHFYWPKVPLCQRKQFYYKVQRSFYMRCLNKSTISEIGKEGYRYLSHNLPDYSYVFDLPTRNNYGGVALLIHQEHNQFKERPDLKMNKSCNCDDCGYENVWGELKLGKETLVIGGIYRHPKGKVQHFVDDMEATLQKLGSNATHIILGGININLLNC